MFGRPCFGKPVTRPHKESVKIHNTRSEPTIAILVSVPIPGLLTRNNSIDCHEYKTTGNLERKQIFDAVAAASIINNCSGVDTSKSQVITLATFTKFLESRQQEKLNDDEIKALVKVIPPEFFSSPS